MDLLRSLWCWVRGHDWGPWCRLNEPAPHGSHWCTARFCHRCEAMDVGAHLRTTEAK